MAASGKLQVVVQSSSGVYAAHTPFLKNCIEIDSIDDKNQKKYCTENL
jgi:hypothetical protein